MHLFNSVVSVLKNRIDNVEQFYPCYAKRNLQLIFE